MIAEITRELEGKLMIVQPWLRNHSDIADLAKDSLITFRVVTCLNAHGDPEATMAMLRVLAKLEPDWANALDEEYAAPIELETGRLGLFTGDNMATSTLRYDVQPITGAQVAGRIVKEWPAVRDIALRAHRAIRHRAAIGWDIALTPEGPMVLEGNNNFDVMFLQRVHDVGIGRTRLGVLLAHQFDLLIAGRKDVWAT
ncbi:sugar-transfer associated ATP-grasp domain-containing protein [Aestuariivirga sp.]|uniref:sugar-transfer associated ATP-grasp domain-containing protein n=1 Tax=Aestuariivirga sp. TaxID=2650926 RepID=UPI0039E34E45